MWRSLARVVAGWWLLTLGAPGAEARRVPALERSVSPVRQQAELERILADVRAEAAAGRTPVVIFDIDDTILYTDRNGLTGRPVPGAVKYVKAVLRAGAVVVYLTGRRENELRRTRAQLTQGGFPLGGQARLMMNPARTWERALRWKSRARRIIDKLGPTVAVFENEKENVRMFRAGYPAARIVRVNTRSDYPDNGRGARGIVVVEHLLRTGRALAPRGGAARGRSGAPR
jgi:hypothetical protein